jgi:hypothetical protein
MEADRQRLARWIAGVETPEVRQIDDERIDAVLALAREEGVVCQLEHRPQGLTGALPEGGARWPALLRDAARDETLRSMMLEGETRRVLAALKALGIPGLLLKGSALAHWAYQKSHLRSCSDVDLLLPSRDDAETLATALLRYELMCTRQVTPDWAVEVDIHWRLSNSALHADRFSFDELMAASVAIPSLGPNARGLGPVHAMLHAAMHRVSNIDQWCGRPPEMAVRLCGAGKAPGPERLGAAGGAGARAAAGGRDAERAGGDVGHVRHGVSRGGAGQRCVRRRKGEPLDASRLDDWAYMQAQTMRALPGWGPKLRWLWQRVFPSRDYMTYLYGDQGSYGGLLRERVKRAWASGGGEQARPASLFVQ